MSDYFEGERSITATTPLGPDTLLLKGFSGVEGISQPFHFRLEMQAVNGTPVPFDRLLGKSVTVRLELDGSANRYFNGICSRVSEGAPDATFTPYILEIVPQFWFLSRIARSRTFQQISVPDILKKVLADIGVEFRLQGVYHPRDYCVQYRETDLNFASRLMEEEGIFYFFVNRSGSHTMVVSDTPSTHPDLPFRSSIVFENSESGDREADRITSWEKTQDLRSEKVTLRDYSFEMPKKTLQAEKRTMDSVQVGQTSHKLKIGNGDKLEIYDYPGEYAQRYDGIDPGGGDRPVDLQWMIDDAPRTAGIRMEEETASAVSIQGTGHCRYLVSGHRFSLERLEPNVGSYLVVSVQHVARLRGDFRSDSDQEGGYFNTFTCIPAALPFRPRRVTPKPVIHGTQTAVVVGPAGQEIFCDKFGRVKAQFPWDREGKNNIDSSCWIRVGTHWAGTQWGAVHIPRIGQEVLVAFEEGDPDQPIIVGNVYNADFMPPYKLPDNKTQSGIKSRSTPHGTPDNFNELRFEDLKGSEQVYFHAERDFDRVVENNDTHKIGFQKKEDGDQTIEIFNNQTLKVGTPQANDGSQSITIHNNRTVVIDMGNDSLTIKMGDQTTKINLGSSTTEALQSIELKVGQSSVKLDQTGVTIKGMMISIEGQVQTEVKGMITQVNGDAMLKCSGGIVMIN